MSRKITLDQLTIVSPCPKSWDEMNRAGDARRFCDHCEKHVHDLSLMRLSDAERLICESSGGVCVRMSRDASGTLITLDYAPPATRCARWKTWGPIAVAIAAAGTILGLMQTGKAVANPRQRIMGLIAAPQPVVIGEASHIEMGDIAAPATQSTTQPTTQPADSRVEMGRIKVGKVAPHL